MLVNEVIKRDVLEGDKADEARKKPGQRTPHCGLVPQGGVRTSPKREARRPSSWREKPGAAWRCSPRSRSGDELRASVDCVGAAILYMTDAAKTDNDAHQANLAGLDDRVDHVGNPYDLNFASKYCIKLLTKLITRSASS